MNINRAYKTELRPNNIQRGLLLKSSGVARFAYNWGLQRKQEVYAMNQLPVERIRNPTAIDLHKELNQLKRTDFPWMYEVSKCAPQEALRDLDDAFKKFFKGLSKYPRFKSKRNGIGSFSITTGSIKIFDDKIQIPTIGKVKLKEKNYLPKNIKIKEITMTERAGHWFVSVNVEEELDEPVNHGIKVGLDLGINRLATLSDGTMIDNPRALKRHSRKLKRTQRGVSRKVKGSNNRRKSVKRIAQLHYRISNIRKDAINKATTMLTRTKSVIVIEDLNVRGMVKNHNLANGITDAMFGEFRRQLEYKGSWYGSKIIVANRFYPSSKMCSRCGHVKKELKLSERLYKCEVCHLEIDRDLNASINLLRLADSSSESVNACLRREVADGRETGQCPSVIQELNAIEGRGVLNG